MSLKDICQPVSTQKGHLLINWKNNRVKGSGEQGIKNNLYSQPLWSRNKQIGRIPSSKNSAYISSFLYNNCW